MNWKSLLVVLGTAAGIACTSKAPHHPTISLVRVPHTGLQPQAIVDGGKLHLLYYSGEPKSGDLFYVTSPDYGATWSAPVRVNSDPGTAIAAGTIRGGQMALGRGGHVYVAWNGSDAAQSRGPMNPEAKQRGAPMLFSRLNEKGTAFEPDRNLMKRTFGLDGGGTVGADRAGNVYVAWHGKAAGAAAGEAGRRVWIAVSHNDGATFSPEQPAWNEPTGACGCCGMGISADSKGTLRVLYRSATEGIHRDIYLLTSADNGARFEGRKLHTWDINACPMTSMSFSEGKGTVEGAWETGGQVYFERLNGSGSAPIGMTGEPKNRKHPRIAIDPAGDTLMISTEGTGWQRGGSITWQMFDCDGKPSGPRGGAAGVPANSFGAVVAKPGGFLIVY